MAAAACRCAAAAAVAYYSGSDALRRLLPDTAGALDRLELWLWGTGELPLLRAHDHAHYGLPESGDHVRVRGAYAVGVDRRLRIPRWVVHHTNRRLRDGRSPGLRRFDWAADETVEEPFRVHPSEYRRCGYDRGHLAAAADCRTAPAVKESFLMTNAVPQHPPRNRGCWRQLEAWTRRLCGKGAVAELWVASGPLFLPRTEEGSADAPRPRRVVSYEVIGRDPGVAVPTHLFRVLLARGARGELSCCAFVAPNTEADPGPVTQMSPAAVERAAGLLLFPALGRPVSELPDLCAIPGCAPTEDVGAQLLQPSTPPTPRRRRGARPASA
eukprot:TRINITY_DN11734_c0_g1_i1.p2 TRINITY_DN11734_c0_g1~~TRINITY_DN11734_c0_g1_i1.p2  ORF type:complete len:351 (+),score=113.24 TRINITY_DN11734_c0_g1_i1:73-1053(+)